MLIDDLKSARILAAHTRPYFSSIIFGFNFVPTTEIPTVACDERLNFYYNPEFQMSKDEAVGVILHEVGHVFRKHHERGSGRNPQAWNVAGDAIINKELRESGIKLPDGTIDYRELGMSSADTSSTEEAYTFLFDGDNGDDEQDQGSPGDGSGDGAEGGNGNDGSGDENGESDSGDEGEDGNGDGEDGSGDEGHSGSSQSNLPDPDCGSVADGSHRSYETDEGMPPSSVEVAVEQAAQDVLDHEASNPGTVPSGILIRARQVKAKSVSLEKAMRRIIGNADAEKKTGTDDYTYTRPSRRHGSSDIVFASMQSVDTVLRVGVVLDTSGSMLRGELQKALGALTSMSKKVKMEIYATSADTRGYGVQKLMPSDLMKWFDSIRGGGGTDLVPGIIDVWEFDASKRPDIVVILTDGEVFFPEKKPVPKKVPVFMLKVSDIRLSHDLTPPPWIRVFELSKS